MAHNGARRAGPHNPHVPLGGRGRRPRAGHHRRMRAAERVSPGPPAAAPFMVHGGLHLWRAAASVHGLWEGPFSAGDSVFDKPDAAVHRQHHRRARRHAHGAATSTSTHTHTHTNMRSRARARTHAHTHTHTHTHTHLYAHTRQARSVVRGFEPRGRGAPTVTRAAIVRRAGLPPPGPRHP